MKANEVAPQVGASIGLLPHGGRILDQLGLYEEVEKHIEPMIKTITTYPDGLSSVSCWARIIHERYMTQYKSLASLTEELQIRSFFRLSRAPETARDIVRWVPRPKQDSSSDPSCFGDGARR